MITIYHNNSCQKSRQGVAYLRSLDIEFEIIDYTNTLFTKNELVEVLSKLNYKPIDLIRKKEKIWIENFKGKTLSDDEIIQAMLQNPKLIERPIIVYENKAVVARPTEKIADLF